MDHREDQEIDTGVDEVTRAVQRLGEHWDTVQVFVSRQASGGETVSHVDGSGNFHARVRLAETFVLRNNEYERCHARKKDGQT